MPCAAPIFLSLLHYLLSETRLERFIEIFAAYSLLKECVHWLYSRRGSTHRQAAVLAKGPLQREVRGTDICEIRNDESEIQRSALRVSSQRVVQPPPFSPCPANSTAHPFGHRSYFTRSSLLGNHPASPSSLSTSPHPSSITLPANLFRASFTGEESP